MGNKQSSKPYGHNRRSYIRSHQGGGRRSLSHSTSFQESSPTFSSMRNFNDPVSSTTVTGSCQPFVSHPKTLPVQSVDFFGDGRAPSRSAKHSQSLVESRDDSEYSSPLSPQNDADVSFISVYLDAKTSLNSPDPIEFSNGEYCLPLDEESDADLLQEIQSTLATTSLNDSKSVVDSTCQV